MTRERRPRRRTWLARAYRANQALPVQIAVAVFVAIALVDKLTAIDSVASVLLVVGLAFALLGFVFEIWLEIQHRRRVKRARTRRPRG